MVTHLDLGGRLVGPGCPCLVIAEAGVNHNGDLDLALQLIDAAAEAGADVVKFQTFKADRLASATAPKAAYQARATGGTESQQDMLRRLELPPEGYLTLMDRCRQRGVLFLSTPFDEASADLLEALEVAAFKLPSGEVVNTPFIGHVASKGRPIILSTGMATLGEVEAAVMAVDKAGSPPLALLHCVSSYPADPADTNLRAMRTMAEAFGVVTGYSDHTMGPAVPLAAVALGAAIIEKHLTLDRRLPGPDHQASAEPAELAELVRGIRTVEAALGSGRKIPAKAELATAAVARKSLVARRDLEAGERIGPSDLAVMRPGTGLPPAMLPLVAGRRTRVRVPAGSLLGLEMLG